MGAQKEFQTQLGTPKQSIYRCIARHKEKNDFFSDAGLENFDFENKNSWQFNMRRVQV
jgi:hypothetical protein